MLTALLDTCSSYIGVLITIWDLLVQKWKQHNLPSALHIGGKIHGETVIITGPTSGIGAQVARLLALRGAIVILACRNNAKGQGLKASIEKEAKGLGRAVSLEIWDLDVASLDSVRRFAERWLQTRRPLHCLINNAGIFTIAGPRYETTDGFESHLETNHLGHFLLTQFLLPCLQKSGVQKTSRIVMTSSIMHTCCRSLPKKDMNLKFNRSYSSVRAYGLSKMVQLLCIAHWKQIYAKDNSVAFFACHPGEAFTPIGYNSMPKLLQKPYQTLLPPLLLTPENATRSILLCATSDPQDLSWDTKAIKNSFIGVSGQPEQWMKLALNENEAVWIFDWSCRQVKVNASPQS